MFHWQIEEAEREVESRKTAYLKRFGWTQTCSTPGSFWLWRRDFADVDAVRGQIRDRIAAKAEANNRSPPSPHVPYGIITADLDLAVSMTASTLDQMDEIEEDAA